MKLPALRSGAAIWVDVLVRFASVALLLAATAPAFAAVSLRVEGRSEPIEAYVRVTDVNGDPVEGLSAADFEVIIDNPPAITINPGDVTLPPDEDATQKVSVIFAMDYSGSVTEIALAAMEQAVIDFAEAMSDGDQVAIVKFNNTNPERASVVLPFTIIDHGPNNDAIDAAVLADYPGDGTNLLDAIQVAAEHFEAQALALPEGPKAIVVVSDGGDLHSEITQAEAVEAANAAGLPVFSIGIGDVEIKGNEELLIALGDETGGQYFPTEDEPDIAEAYATIQILLTQEYLIKIPSGLADCQVHVMTVTVAGESDSANFTRRTCDSEPNPFSFASLTDRRPGTTVVSDTVTISGIEIPAHISVIQGSYSIGCVDGGFTTQPGTIENGDELCLRQQSSAEFSTSKTTTVTVGGVAGTFTTTTHADSSGSSGGGGGAAGLAEILLGFGLLLLARRRLA